MTFKFKFRPWKKPPPVPPTCLPVVAIEESQEFLDQGSLAGEREKRSLWRVIYKSLVIGERNIKEPQNLPNHRVDLLEVIFV